MMKHIYIFLILLCCNLSLLAQNTAIDNTELSFSENLALPKVPNKAVKPLREHMSKIRNSLLKGISDVDLLRNQEIVRVIIPCADVFAPNSPVILESGKPYLRPFLNLLKYPTMYKVVIAVHSDNTGEPGYLDALTEMRANAIDDFLIDESHTSGDNVIPYGMGCEDPIEPNNSVANRAKNRRIEIYIVPEKKLIEQAKSGKL